MRNQAVTKRIHSWLAIATALLIAVFPSSASPQSVDGDAIERSLNEEIVGIPGPGGRTLAATWYRPDGRGPFPLIVLSHGSPANVSGRPLMGRWRQLAPIREFVKRGYAVLVPMRRGLGATGGTFEEGSDCRNPDFHRAGMEGAKDILAAVSYGQAQTFVRADQVLLVGHSKGGFVSIAAASHAPAGVTAVINFAGGSGGDPSTTPGEPCFPQRMAETYERWGKTTPVPVLWHYSENDQFFGPDHAKNWFAAFTRAGGKGRLVMERPFGRDGHILWDPLESTCRHASLSIL